MIAAGASLDLTNNALVLDYTSTSPLATIQAMLADGRIDTSVATPGAAVGFAEANRIFTSFPANFAAQSIDSTTVLLIQTLAGDTNLDRNVNFDDLLRLAQNYGLSGKTWADGDFDYNGSVNFDERSFDINDESNINVIDSAFAARMIGDFERDKAQSKSIQLADLKKTPWHKRLFERFTSLFGPQL